MRCARRNTRVRDAGGRRATVPGIWKVPFDAKAKSHLIELRSRYHTVAFTGRQ